MAYYDDGYSSSESEEEVELCEMELFRGPKPKNVEVYDKKSWDYRVAQEISKIHREAFQKQINQKFSDWVNANLEHLEKLHKLSGLKTPEETFYTFIYDHCR